MKRIQSLDGWRGFAILLVLAEHYQAAIFSRGNQPFKAFGLHGVTIFFVLSGYLITGNLLDRGIHLRAFYLRRFFRLMPVAWAYLLFLFLLQCAYHFRHSLAEDALSALLFYRNFVPEGNLSNGHFWSLSIEEQFYLVWPALMLLCGKRRAIWVASLAALACAVYRFANLAYYEQVQTCFVTQVRADALLVGCLLALALDNPKLHKKIGQITFLWPVALVILVYCIFRFHWIAPLGEDIAVAILIAASVLSPGGKLAKTLMFSPLPWLGTISYSIYVWQQLFIPVMRPNYNPWNVLLMVLFSLASYYAIEQPMRRFGRTLADRLVPRESLGVTG